MKPRFWGLPPGGERIDWGTVRALFATPDAAATLRAELRDLLGVEALTLHRSGREALRVGLLALAKERGRSEVVVPAYTCFSVPSAVVAAGLRVRLVDVTAEGTLDAEALGRLPLDDVLAVVVCNLFGTAEPLEPLAEIARSAGTAVIDDAAQALGAVAPDGAAGGRGDLGLLSFGRGKPLSALGGGALAWPTGAPAAVSEESPPAAPTRALLRAIAHAGALSPRVFPWLERVPALGIGETVFDPGFATGPIGGAALALAAASAASFRKQGRIRAARAGALARAITAASRFRPLGPPEADWVAPRLALVAPDAAARDVALGALAGLGAGASPMYPSALGEVAALRPHLAGESDCRGARDFANRVLTLPTHGALAGAHLDAVVARLREIAPQ